MKICLHSLVSFKNILVKRDIKLILMVNPIKKLFQKLLYKILNKYFRGLLHLHLGHSEILMDTFCGSSIGKFTKLYPVYNIVDSTIDDYTYIAKNSIINNTKIGKFCSIGPNIVCGFGIHPVNKLSTSPMFYSTMKQNGITFSQIDKIIESKRITIGNDVFIGMNVSILDGVTIGDGAIIGAGAIVSKDIPPFAIAVGSPIKIIKYRFDDKTIQSLLKIKWWNWDDSRLEQVEAYFDDIDNFIKKNL